VRRSRRRFWKSQNDEDKLAAYTTLYHCLVTLTKLIAPFTPFIAEEMYRNLVCSVDSEAPESVHLTDYPIADPSKIDEQLVDATRVVMTICSLGRAARAKAGIKVRQPLAGALIKVRSRSEMDGVRKLDHQVLDEINVKHIDFTDDNSLIDQDGYVGVEEGDYWVAIDTRLTQELEAEGMAREIVRRLQTMRRSSGLDIADHITIYCEGDDAVGRVMTEFTDYISQETLSRQITLATIPPEYYQEKHKISGSEIVLGIQKSTD
jgi:isoleucyl-tRNA synthetase